MPEDTVQLYMSVEIPTYSGARGSSGGVSTDAAQAGMAADASAHRARINAISCLVTCFKRNTSVSFVAFYACPT